MQKDAGVPKAFSVGFTTIGHDTCLMADFGDGNKVVYADDINTCSLESGFTGTPAELTAKMHMMMMMMMMTSTTIMMMMVIIIII